MWFGWMILSVIFYGPRSEPKWDAWPKEEKKEEAYKDFKADRDKWNLLYEAAGRKAVLADANDLAETPEQWDKINKAIAENPKSTTVVVDGKVLQRPTKPYGRLCLWPGSEDRGPNPYRLVTGQVDRVSAAGTTTSAPFDRGYFWHWLLTDEGPVVLEPLVKFLRPLVYLVHPKAGFWNHLYFLLVLVWTAFVWAVFGGAITRMAAVQIARRDKISPLEALRFTWERIISYFTAPLLPVVCTAVIVVFLIIFGLVHFIPWLGDIWSGLLWPVVILAGLAMAAVLIGLIGWPLMVATISTEGSDNFDALSRSYSYIYQYPWHYAWYCLVATVYGAALIFFVGFMGSWLVYLGKWGVEQTPALESSPRDPSYLFAYAPTSFGWRALLMDGAEVKSPTGPTKVVENGLIVEPAYQEYLGTYTILNKFGAFLVSAWVHVVFLLVLGFGYSYFWTASTIIYLLMRRKVDDTDFDEVYLEEEEPEETYSMTTPSSPAVGPTPTGGTGPIQMVDAPSLRTTAPPPSPTSPAPAAPEHEGAGTVVAHQPAATDSSPPEGSSGPGGDGSPPAQGGPS
jgi:hypothetical protein